MPFGSFNPLQALMMGGMGGGQGGLSGLISPEDNQNAMLMGLLQAGGSLLESGGPNPQRVGLGQALGRGLQAGLGGYQGALQTNLQGRLAQQQFEKARSEQELAQRRYGLDEQRLQQQMSQDAARLDIDRQKLARGNVSLPEGFSFDPATGRQVPPSGDVEAALLRRRSAGAQRLTINQQQETEESKKVGQFYGELHTNLQKGAIESSALQSKMNRLDQLLDQVETGKFAGRTLELKKAAKAVGLDLGDTGPAEAAAALAGEMALAVRNPAGGAGMPGALSERDLAFLQSMVPGIEMTREGRKLVKETFARMNRRSQQVAKMATDYRAKNKHLDDGFMAQLQQFSEQNPLFADLQPPGSQAPGDVSRETSGAAVPEVSGITPEAIGKLDLDPLLGLDLSKLSKAQRDAYSARLTTLGY